MKTVLAIPLSFLVFFQSMGVSVVDVFMLKDFVEHVQYHSEEFGDDFFTFVEKHYGDLKKEHHKNHQEEQSQHEKLPFQHHSSNHLLVEVVVMGYEFPLKKEVIYTTSNQHFYYQDLYSFFEKASIFQPPKSA